MAGNIDSALLISFVTLFFGNNDALSPGLDLLGKIDLLLPSFRLRVDLVRIVDLLLPSLEPGLDLVAKIANLLFPSLELGADLVGEVDDLDKVSDFTGESDDLTKVADFFGEVDDLDKRGDFVDLTVGNLAIDLERGFDFTSPNLDCERLSSFRSVVDFDLSQSVPAGLGVDARKSGPVAAANALPTIDYN